MDQEKISVIVPVYKVEEYLQRCVESIRNQTYENLEIILVDDGSPDTCGVQCDRFAMEDTRIIVMHQHNKGLSGARNTGLSIASGKYIYFADSDDYLSRDCIERLKLKLSQSGADIALSNTCTITENGYILGQSSFAGDEEYIGDEIVENVVIPLHTSAWNKLFRRECLQGCSFPEGHVHGEDLVFFLQVINKNSRLITVGNVGYYYLKRAESITTGAFSVRSFDEVYCKDLASEILKTKFPEYVLSSQIWQFRARMNVLRKISISGSREWKEKAREYKNWLRNNYKALRNGLGIKEKMEYLLYQKPILYKTMITLYKSIREWTGCRK